jgi:hypothetical protein
LAIALGGLTKWFPILILPAIWKVRKRKRALTITLVSLAGMIIVWGILFGASPEYVKASLLSQLNKGSWETIWALIDGNLLTGNFSIRNNRFEPATAVIATGNPAVIPSWLSLVIFGSIGLYVLIKAKPLSKSWLIDFLGLTLVIFYCWSPGYSPQWVLYLLPLLLISLEEIEAVLFGAVIILVHLLEWPMLLSRGYFQALWYLIPLRTGLIVVLGVRFYQLTQKTANAIGTKNAR